MNSHSSQARLIGTGGKEDNGGKFPRNLRSDF